MVNELANISPRAAVASSRHDTSELRSFGSFTQVLLIIAALFFFKSAAFALWVTPLWEIPDESGHYSYIDDLSRGEYPVLGKARMTDDVAISWLGPKHKPGPNWIAQHPPLFYALDAPVVVMAKATGLGFEGQVRSARLLSSLFGAMTLLGIGLLIRAATDQPILGLAGAIFIGATPMFIQLSSGVTHDTLVACTAAWGIYWCFKWLKSGSFNHALICAFLIGMCTITKITGLGLAVPLFAAMAYRLIAQKDLQLRTRILSVSMLWLVMFLPICLWMLRNYILFHEFMPNAGIFIAPRPVNVDIGFFDFMRKFPIWQNVLLNFVALIGWTGQSHGTVNFVQATGFTAQYFLGAILFSCALVILHPLRNLIGDFKLNVVAASLLVACAYLAATLTSHELATLTCAAILSIVTWTAIKNMRGATSNEKSAWFLFTGSACVLFFSFLYYHRIWDSHLNYGSVKALHGRYFYPVMPFLCLILLQPFTQKEYAFSALFVAIVAAAVSDGFFLHHAFALYGQV